jgi:hypothetical protein
MTRISSAAAPAPAPMPALAPVERPVLEFAVAVTPAVAVAVAPAPLVNIWECEDVPPMEDGKEMSATVELARKFIPVMVQVAVRGIVVTPAPLQSSLR